jgi:hypothetical protein
VSPGLPQETREVALRFTGPVKTIHVFEWIFGEPARLAGAGAAG